MSQLHSSDGENEGGGGGGGILGGECLGKKAQ